MKSLKLLFMLTIIICLFVSQTVIYTEVYAQKNTDSIETPSNLYSRSACLMDADSGRVLFEKNGSNKMPMASTTKIMTLIVALENGSLDDIVTVSKLAAKQPDVQLNINTGEKYYLKDLLYSLMLESHNDSAYAIAEHIGGSVEKFADLMNEKAKFIGAADTYFITPNGLDASDASGTHSTTAVDLAKIMSYCIKQSPKKENFLKITRTPSYTFSDIEGKRSFSCNNHNAFLNMMEGALSGKTGFTGNAGYCYVGALERDGKTFVVALLACGWPNNKSYKWSDTKKLMNYGIENFEFKSFEDVEIDSARLNSICVENGQTEDIGGNAMTGIQINGEEIYNDSAKKGIVLRSDENIEVSYNIPEKLIAPVAENEIVGSISYLVNGEVWRKDNVVTTEKIDKIDYKWCIKMVLKKFLP